MEEGKAIEDKLKLEGQFKGGAGWFFWIAGLSVINSAVTLFGGSWGFIVGLGMTQFIDAVAKQAGGAGPAIGLFASLIVSGVFVLFGVLARKRMGWAFIVGMILYGLDGLLFLVVKDILGFGFHLFALYWIFMGARALAKLKELERPAPGTVPTPTG